MDKLEAIRIDLADYEYAGEGANITSTRVKGPTA